LQFITAPSNQSMPFTSLSLVRIVWRLFPAHCRAQITECWGRAFRSEIESERSRLTWPETVTRWVVASMCGMGPWLRS
jgi:hypothetical protein